MDGGTTGAGLLAGRYELEEVIGSGGMATVWRARDRELRRPVAVKVLRERMAADLPARHRFSREARHVASLSHPNIVTVFDLGTDGERSFIVMEHVDGQSLDRLLADGGTLPVAGTVALAVDVLAALEHAHQHGIIHRDVKPGNLLVSTPGGRVLVTDFGVARGVEDTSELTLHGAFVGTAAYASPEQLTGGRVGPPADLYSLGCVLYRCLAGHPPFEGDVDQLVLQHRFGEAPPLSVAGADVPPWLDAVVAQALAKGPDERFAGAAAMRHALTSRDAPASPAVTSGGPTTPAIIRGVPTTPAVTSGGPTTLPVAGPTPGPLAGSRRGHPVDDALCTGPEGHRNGEGTDPGPSTTREGLPGDGASARRRRLLLVAVVSVVVASVAALATSWVLALSSGNHTAGPARAEGSTTGTRTGPLPSGGFLRPGDSLRSADGRYVLSMQADGNLVDYAERRPGRSRQPLWQSGTSGNFGAYAVVQADGDFVVYPEGQSAPAPGRPTPALWSAGTYGHPGSSVALEDDGAVVVLSAGEHAVLWSSGPRG